MIDEETGAPRKADKELGAVKSGIAALSEKIEKSGCKTLGQYFFKRLNEEKGQVAKKRIRGVYTGRIEHYIVEFNAIMDAQGYSADNRLRTDLYNAIFIQRPLRSQKHLVGKCPLEPKNARAMIGHPAFEEFRMLSFVNNLSFENENGEYKDEFGNYSSTAQRINVTEEGPLSVSLSSQKPGSFCLTVVVKHGVDTVLTVPYYFIIE